MLKIILGYLPMNLPEGNFHKVIPLHDAPDVSGVRLKRSSPTYAGVGMSLLS